MFRLVVLVSGVLVSRLSILFILKCDIGRLSRCMNILVSGLLVSGLVLVSV